MQQQNIQAQAQANQQSQQVAAQLSVQKEQAIVQSKIQLEQAKSQFDTQKLMQEAQLKKELMAYEFQINLKLQEGQVAVKKSQESYKEDRKDDRTKIQATQQSELIEQRKNNTPPQNFESSGNDIMGGGFGLGSFDPK